MSAITRFVSVREFSLTIHSTFSAIKDLAGDWKQDPRYEDSWYFVIEKPEEK